MDKKGFTIVELLAAIVIIGVLMTFISLSVTGIMANVNNKNYNAIVLEVQTAAETYAIETGRKIFFVQELVDKGYIDYPSGIVTNPVDKTKMNCRPIEVIHENSLYYATITSEAHDLDNNTCDDSALVNSETNFTLDVQKVSGQNYNIIINCPIGYTVVITSNTGYYQVVQNTNQNTYTFNKTFSKTEGVSITATLKLIEENVVKSRTEALN